MISDLDFRSKVCAVIHFEDLVTQINVAIKIVENITFTLIEGLF